MGRLLTRTERAALWHDRTVCHGIGCDIRAEVFWQSGDDVDDWAVFCRLCWSKVEDRVWGSAWSLESDAVMEMLAVKAAR